MPNGLAPHRLRTLKLSRDPHFAAKIRDVVGLYVDPSAHAVVLSIDEKSQIQALDRAQPGLPTKRGRAGTITHDYIRNGTTTVFAAVNILEGTVIGQCMQRHRHQEFLRFLNRLERDIPAGWPISCSTIMAATPTPKSGPGWRAIRAGPSTSPRLRRPGSMRLKVSFAKLTRRRLKRGVFHSLVDLQGAINRYFAYHNANPRPFVWTADPDRIIAAVRRGYQVLDSIHSHVRLCQMQAGEFVAREHALVFRLFRAGQEARSLKRRLIIL